MMNSCRWLNKFGLACALAVLITASGILAAEKPAGTGAAKGEKSAEKLPSAQEVVDRFVKAIGGADTFTKYKSQHAKGTAEMTAQNLKGDMEIFAARPDKLLMRVVMGPLGEVTTCYNGKAGWMNSAATGPILLEGKMLEQVASQANFDKTLHRAEDFTTMEVVGKENFNGEECYKLKLVDKSGAETTEYFSVKTGLQTGFVASQESPFGAITATTLIADYKKFGDLLMPAKVIQKAGGMESTMTLSEMEFNTVNPEVFTPPAAIQTLIEAKNTKK